MSAGNIAARAAEAAAAADTGGLGEVFASSFTRAPWGWALLATVLLALVKGWPAIQDAATRARMSLGDRRVSRIEKLEATVERQRAEHDAEVSILRHQLNNVEQCLNYLLLLIETAPEKAAEHAKRIRDMRVDQARTETMEKATIRGARVGAAEAEEPKA